MKDILNSDIPVVQDTKLQEGVYYAVITDVQRVNDTRIKVKFDLTLDDDSQYEIYARINLIPKYSYDFINRLAQACRTRKPIEFVNKEVYVSVVINEPSLSERYENVQDVMYYDDSVEFEYQLTEKGYFYR